MERRIVSALTGQDPASPPGPGPHTRALPPDAPKLPWPWRPPVALARVAKHLAALPRVSPVGATLWAKHRSALAQRAKYREAGALACGTFCRSYEVIVDFVYWIGRGLLRLFPHIIC